MPRAQPPLRRPPLTRRVPPLAALLLAVLAFALGTAAATAQPPAPAAPPPDSPPAGASEGRSGAALDELQRLVSTLEDEAQRTQLLANLRALLAAQQQAEEPPASLGDRLLGYAATAARQAQDSMDDLSGYARGWPVLVQWVQRELRDPAARARGLQEALAFLSVFAAGFAAEMALWWLLAGTRRAIDGAVRAAGASRLLPITARLLLDLFPLVGFFAAAYAAALLIEPQPTVRAVGLNFVHAYLLARGLMAVARLLLAPTSRPLRLLPLSDGVAADLYAWARRFVATGVIGYFVIAAALLLGLPRRGADTLLHLLGFVLAAMAVAFVVTHRRRVAAWLRRRADAASRRYGAAQFLNGLAAGWHVLAIAYITGFFVIAAFAIKGGFAYMLRGTAISLLVVVAVWLLLLGVDRGLQRLRRDATAGAPAPPAGTPPLRSRLSSYVPAFATVLRIVVCAAALLVVLEAWGLGAFAWLQHPFGQRTVGAVASVLLVLGFAVLVWETASSAIERYLAQQQRDGTAQRSARVRTLLPLLRKALFVFLSLMVVLITLSELGVNIAPLLAGAGVIGLAIGFGSQKLVQDVITGIFMLVEDAIAVGDVVNVAGVGGVVEDLSIRSIRLRDLSGNVHTVPFSSVDTVTNMTKGFSFYVFNISVDYREDTDRVAEACKQIVEEMRADPQFGVDILEPLEVFGIDQFAESAVILQARVKTRPIRQWAVGREFNRRMKKRFAELGIEIPYPHRTVYLDAAGEGGLPLRVQLEGWPPPAPPVAAPPAAPPVTAPSAASALSPAAPAGAPEAGSAAAGTATPGARSEAGAARGSGRAERPRRRKPTSPPPEPEQT